MSSSKPDLQKTLEDVKSLIDTAKPLLEKVSTLEENEEPVSYTHLDVYKRQ